MNGFMVDIGDSIAVSACSVCKCFEVYMCVGSIDSTPRGILSMVGSESLANQ